MGLFDKFRQSKFEIKPFGNAKKENIIKIEKEFDVILPIDYKKFLFNYNGGKVSNNEFNEIHLDDVNVNINIDVLYGIHTGYSNSDIEYWTNKYVEDLFEKTIIIGDSLQHGFIVLICDGFNDGIYYYDDSYHFDNSNDESNIYLIADTFDKFWELLSKQ